MSEHKFYLMEEAQREALIRVAKRLYTENRLNGDEMRDLAHCITSVVNTSFELEIGENGHYRR